MDRREQVQYLNQTLLAEMPQYREQAEAFPVDAFSQRRLLRSLMNVRPPMPLAPKFLEVQDALLSAEREERASELEKLKRNMFGQKAAGAIAAEYASDSAKLEKLLENKDYIDLKKGTACGIRRGL